MSKKSQKVKPIETVYNGYKFRSRLEARWAVFMDVMGWPYEYEPEGYDLGDAGYYLPDFWIPINPAENATGHEGAGYFIEVKGQNPSASAKKKIAELAKMTKHTVKLFVGSPWKFKYAACHHLHADDFTGKIRYQKGFEKDGFPMGIVAFHTQIMWDHTGNSVHNIEEAIAAAKQARFEHGETPQARRFEHAY
jgi:hypothetical protein